MTKFRVEGYVQRTINICEEIEAENKDDAINKMYFKLDECDGKINDFDFEAIELKE